MRNLTIECERDGSGILFCDESIPAALLGQCKKDRADSADFSPKQFCYLKKFHTSPKRTMKSRYG